MQKENGLSLAQTLECGQCFRWERQEDGSYAGIAGGRWLRVSEDSLADVLRDKFWAHYFDMELDYDAVRRSLSRMDPVLAEAACYAPGIRILNQDPWETLCSFILSQANNIPRIRGLVRRICLLCGPAIGGGHRGFPSAAAVSGLSEKDLRAAGCGFRAAYVLDAARKTASGEIDFACLREMPLEQAREKLTSVAGVGPKVADCTLLYGLHRLEAFPMDVWMKRAMKSLFPGRTPADFGRYAGVAQQYIFHYSRNHPELFREKVH